MPALQAIAVRRVHAEDLHHIGEEFELLQRMRVDLIVVSGVERELYSAGDIEKFDRHPELFIPVVSFGQARLYVSAFSPYRSLFEGKNS